MTCRLYLCLLVAGVVILAVGRPAPASSLIEAVSMGDTEEVQTLLVQGADLNATDNDGLTALMWAAKHCHIDIVQLLLAKGADVNAKDNKGGTALIAAKREGHKEIVCILKEAGAKK
jgi:ankyrin repeat protein